MSPKEDKTQSLLFRFKFPDGNTKEFDVRLNAGSLSLVLPDTTDVPDWTKLGFEQCSNCPLNEKQYPQCPVARSLAGVIEFFKDSISYDQAELEIVTPERTYRKQCPLQQGISSLIGIYMVTSGCPILEKFKPMVGTHLPFATTRETVYRVYSMYLLAQYFLMKEGKQPDWNMEKLLGIYEDVRVVNKAFAKRLLAVCKEDAAANALVRLDVFADHSSLMLESDMMDEVRAMFSAYLKSGADGD